MRNYSESSTYVSSYFSTNTSSGVNDLLNGDVSFAGIDAPTGDGLFDPSVQSQYTMIPTSVAALAIGFRVPNCTTLRLSMGNIVDIYTLRVTQWNDPSLLVNNPCLNGAAKTIYALHRTTASGETFMISSIMNQFYPDKWGAADVSFSWPDYKYPAAMNVTGGIPSSSIMLYTLLANDWALGYIPITIVSGTPLAKAQLRGYDNEIFATWSPSILHDTVNGQCNLGCWPLQGFVYIGMPNNNYIEKSNETNPQARRSCLNLQATAKFFSLSVQLDTTSSTTNGQFDLLPPSTKHAALSLLESINCNGKNLLGTDWDMSRKLKIAGTCIGAGLATFFGISIIGVLILIYQERSYLRDLSIIANLAKTDPFADSSYDRPERSTNTELLLPDDDDNQFYIQSNDELAVPLDNMSDYDEEESPGDYQPPSVTPSSSGPSQRSSFSSKQSTVSQHNSASYSSSITKQLLAVMVKKSDFILGNVIGAGSFGEVYSGAFKKKPVAIKKIATPESANLNAQSFLQEVGAMVTLKHENVVALFAICIHPPNTYIISEYCKFGSIEDLRKRLPQLMTKKLKRQLAIDSAKGMEYIHSQGLLHRDLKLTNILVSSDMRAKIADLGTATSGQRIHKTKIGTIDFAAPEVLQEKPYSNACDVFSFAMCLWSLFSPSELYDGLGMFDIMSNVISGNRPDLSSIESSALATLIAACWAQEPSIRPNFTSIVAALEAIDPIELGIDSF